MKRATAKEADMIAGNLLRFGNIEAFRSGELSFHEYCQFYTGSELSSGELDKLAAMVQERVIKNWKGLDPTDEMGQAIALLAETPTTSEAPGIHRDELTDEIIDVCRKWISRERRSRKIIAELDAP